MANRGTTINSRRNKSVIAYLVQTTFSFPLIFPIFFSSKNLKFLIPNFNKNRRTLLVKSNRVI